MTTNLSVQRQKNYKINGLDLTRVKRLDFFKKTKWMSEEEFWKVKIIIQAQCRDHINISKLKICKVVHYGNNLTKFEADILLGYTKDLIGLSNVYHGVLDTIRCDTNIHKIRSSWYQGGWINFHGDEVFAKVYITKCKKEF